jgi:hypothetical protein
MRPHTFTLLMSAVALGGLLTTTSGCPAKGGCPPCYVGGVMSSSGTTTTTTTTTAPSSAVYLQLDGSYSKEKVSQVRVILTDAAGTTETLTYSDQKVERINGSSLTSIADAELHSVNGKPPVSADVEFTFVGGKTSGPISIPVKAETSTTTTPAR